MTQPVLEARGLVKTFGHVVGLAQLIRASSVRACCSRS